MLGHVVKTSAITRMWNGGVPEKAITEMSGHKSLKALRCYEHTLVAQEQAVGMVTANPESTYETVLKQEESKLKKLTVSAAGPSKE